MGLTRLRAEQISDIDYKQAVRVISVSDIANLAGGAPSQVDGVNLTAGDRVLVTGQDPGSENGIYQVQTVGTGSNGTWIRSIDTNQTGELEAGTIVMVTEGSVYKDTQWKLTTNNPIVIGTTALTFEQNSAFAFGNIVANTTAVLADSVGDTVTFSPGLGIAITGNNTTKTVTITATGSAETTAISNGTSNVSVVSSGGNVSVGIGGTANVAVFSTTDIVTAANLLPSANVTYSLGSTGARWNDLWIANSSIYIGDVTIATVGSVLTINGANVLTGNAGANLSTTGNVIGGNILTGGLVSATGNITANYIIGNGSQLTGLPAGYANSDVAAYLSSGTVSTNILTTAALSATGNVTGGNIRTAGLITATGTITSAANIIGGNITTAGLITATGNVQAGNLRTAGLISATGAITGAAITGSSLTVSTGNITGGNLLLSGAIIDSAQLDIQTSAANANIALAPNGTGIVTISTQVSAVGNVTGGNIRTAGLITATGNVNAGNVIATNLTGTLLTAAQTNITSVGTLTSLNSGAISSSGNITTAGQFIGAGTGLTGTAASLTVGTATTAGTVTTAAQPNITSVGTLTSLNSGAISSSGNITTAGQFNGSGAGITALGTSTNYQVGSLAIGGAKIGSAGLTVNGTPDNNDSQIIIKKPSQSTWSQLVWDGSVYQGFNIYYDNSAWVHNGPSNVNSLLTTTDSGMSWYASNNGTSSWNVASNLGLWNLSGTWIGAVSSSSITTTGGLVNGAANGTGNIGSASTYFNTVFAKATSAQYADLAEKYVSDKNYPAGTVVEFGGEKEITITTQSHSTRVAGIVSTNPAFIMNDTLTNDTALPVALTGRVPCSVVGTIEKGDRLVASDIPGVATVLDSAKYQPACIIGKALENYTSDQPGVIEVAVGRT